MPGGKSRIKIQSHSKHPQDRSLTLWFLSATTLSSYWDALEKKTPAVGSETCAQFMEYMNAA